MSALAHLLQRLRRRIDMAWLETREQQLTLAMREAEQRIASDRLQLLALHEQHAETLAALRAAQGQPTTPTTSTP